MIEGQHDERQQDRVFLREALQEDLRKPLRSTLVMKTKSQKRTSGRLEDFPLGDPVGGRCSPRRLLVLLPLIVLPLNLSPEVCSNMMLVAVTLPCSSRHKSQNSCKKSSPPEESQRVPHS